MLIPSIDLQDGHIVQLVQGEKLALQTLDIDAWVQRFAAYPKVQLIDLDAAKGKGRNTELIRRICGELPCRVGGGIRTIDDADRILGAGATHIIIGSALFKEAAVDVETAGRFASRLGSERLIAAVDSKGGRVVIDGWRTTLGISPAEAIRSLAPFVCEFLYTHVDREGLMMGTDVDAIRALRAATTRRLTAAGGITTVEEVAQLDAMGVDAVVGMAIYTGRMDA